jgi:hypothetical protein
MKTYFELLVCSISLPAIQASLADVLLTGSEPCFRTR